MKVFISLSKNCEERIVTLLIGEPIAFILISAEKIKWKIQKYFEDIVVEDLK